MAKKINDKDDAVELQKFDGRSMLRDSLFETKTGKAQNAETAIKVARNAWIGFV